MTSQLLAQESTGVLLRSFVIALVLVAPIAAWQWYRIRARRVAAEVDSSDTIDPEPTHPDTDPRALETIIATIPEVAASIPSGETTSVQVPAGVTVEGRAASPSIVERIVADALSRDGLEVIAARGLSGGPSPESGVSTGRASAGERGWTFECRKR